MSLSDSSTESSPTRRFRNLSPASDHGHRPPTQAGDRSTSLNEPILRQPVGFSNWAPRVSSATPAPAPVAATSQQLPPVTTNSQQLIPSQPPPAPSAEFSSPVPSKDIHSGTPKQRHKSKAPRKQVEAPAPQQPVPKPHTHHTTAFRVRQYVNDPAAAVATQNALPGSGPYTADFRASVQPVGAPPPQRKARRTTKKGRDTAPPAQPVAAVPEEQPRRSYYRYDYDRQRDDAPSRRAKAAASGLTAGQVPIEVHAGPDNFVSDAAGPFHIDDDTRSQSSAHRRSHSSRQNQAMNVYDPAGPSAAPQYMPEALPRMLRILTLLIEDTRSGQPENLLVEVRVPLKPLDNPEDGFWADAKEVSDELQNGPSRIEGRAKVYTMRGKYKQYFLRVTPEDGIDTASANLKVSTDRTIEIFVEDNPPPPGTWTAPPQYASPPAAREMLTPITDTMRSPSPPIEIRRQSSVMSIDQYSDRDESDDETRSSIPTKRHRSSSSYSSRSIANDAQQQRYQSSPHRPSPSQQSLSVPESRQVSQTPSRPSSSQWSPSPEPSSLTYSVTGTPSSKLAPKSPAPHQEQSPASLHPTQPRDSPSPQKKPKRAATNAAPAYPSERRDYAFSHVRTPQKDPAPSLSASTLVPASFAQFGGVSGAFGKSAEQSRAPSAASPSATTAGAGPFSRYSGTFSLAQDTSASLRAGLPTASGSGSAGSATAEVDNAVVVHLRAVFSKEDGWEQYLARRNSVLKVPELLEQYAYVQAKLDAWLGKRTPRDLAAAPDVVVAKEHIMRVFGLRPNWVDDCSEILALNKLYGPRGQRCEDPRAVEMFGAENPISTSIQAERYLKLLREIHSRWTTEH